MVKAMLRRKREHSQSFRPLVTFMIVSVAGEMERYGRGRERERNCVNRKRFSKQWEPVSVFLVGVVCPRRVDSHQPRYKGVLMLREYCIKEWRHSRKNNMANLEDRPRRMTRCAFTVFLSIVQLEGGVRARIVHKYIFAQFSFCTLIMEYIVWS